MATGHTDMRKGFASLSLQVQEVLRSPEWPFVLLPRTQRRSIESDLTWCAAEHRGGEYTEFDVFSLMRERLVLLHRRYSRRCKTTTLWLHLKGAVVSKCCKNPGAGQVTIRKASESESSDVT